MLYIKSLCLPKTVLGEYQPSVSSVRTSLHSIPTLRPRADILSVLLSFQYWLLYVSLSANSDNFVSKHHSCELSQKSFFWKSSKFYMLSWETMKFSEPTLQENVWTSVRRILILIEELQEVLLAIINLCSQVLKDCLKQIKLHADGEDEPGE